VPEKSQLLRTRDVLEATGITHQILYRYVTMGLVEELESRGPARGGRGPRRFPAETIAAIKLIQSLNQSGYTLRDIKDIFFKEKRLRGFRRRWAQKGVRKR
jgi:DNA-binding transcriptional MerR regulator